MKAFSVDSTPLTRRVRSVYNGRMSYYDFKLSPSATALALKAWEDGEYELCFGWERPYVGRIDRLGDEGWAARGAILRPYLRPADSRRIVRTAGFKFVCLDLPVAPTVAWCVFAEERGLGASSGPPRNDRRVARAYFEFLREST